jgi:hypothetical protein
MGRHVREVCFIDPRKSHYNRLSYFTSLQVLRVRTFDPFVLEKRLHILGNVLTELNIYSLNNYRTPRITDDILEQIFQQTPNLKILSMESCSYVRGTCLKAIKSKLEVLYMSSLELITHGDDTPIELPYLQVLELYMVPLSICFDLRAPNLQLVTIFNCNLDDNEALETLFQNSQRIKRLEVHYCQFGDTHLDVISKSPVATSLESILFWPGQFDEARFIDFSRACPALKEIEISGKKISQAGYLSILGNLPKVQKVTMQPVSINYQFFLSISDMCKNLTHLHLHGVELDRKMVASLKEDKRWRLAMAVMFDTHPFLETVFFENDVVTREILESNMTKE